MTTLPFLSGSDVLLALLVGGNYISLLLCLGFAFTGNPLAINILSTWWLATLIQYLLAGLFVAVLKIAGLNSTTAWPQYYYLLRTVVYLACPVLSFIVPYWNARSRASLVQFTLKKYLEAPGPGQSAWWWRQLVLTLGVGACALLSGIHLSPYLTERDDKIRRDSPWRFFFEFPFTQIQECVIYRLFPIIALNTIPRSAYRIARMQNVTIHKIPGPLSARPYVTDTMGLLSFACSALLVTTALIDKLSQCNNGTHSPGPQSRYIQYAANLVWGGIVLTAGGTLVRNSALEGLGLSRGWVGKSFIVVMCVLSLASVYLEPLKKMIL